MNKTGTQRIETESAYTGDYLYYEIVLRGYEEIGKEVRI